MAQDYDSPRNKDEDEESLQELGKGSRSSSTDMDDDENAIAEDYELPGADLSNEDASVTVIRMQNDEFICSECFLVKHRSQLAYVTDDGQPVCEECAARWRSTRHMTSPNTPRSWSNRLIPAIRSSCGTPTPGTRAPTWSPPRT